MPTVSDAAFVAAPSRDAPLRTTRTEALLLAAGVLAFGFAACALGQSNNWDLRNYHWYGGWAWLQGRGQQDIAAAQAQTWFNPLLPALLYALLSSLKPALGTFLLGAIQGLNLLPLQRIARRLLPPQRCWLAFVVAVVGATGATQRGELGATFGDNLVSLPLLAALALLLAPHDSRWRQTATGALLGLAVGIKLTAAPIAAGIAIAALAAALRRGTARADGPYLIGAAALTFLFAHGPWMWQLWRDFHNPLFPLFGPVFGGDFVAPAELRDTRWLPRSAAEWLFYPLLWAGSPRRVSELWFLDLRLPLAYVALLALPVWWRRARAQSAQPRALVLLLTAFATGYLLWLPLFGYYRYLAVIEMLAPLLVTLAALALPRRSGLFLAVSLLIIVGLATRAPRWGRLSEYGEHYVDVVVPSVSLEQALVIFGDGHPLAFLAPSFPPSTRFVRLRGNLLGPPLPVWALDRLVQERIRAHHGPLFLLVAAPIGAELTDALAQQGLRLHGVCRPVRSNLFADEPPAQLCPLQR